MIDKMALLIDFLEGTPSDLKSMSQQEVEEYLERRGLNADAVYVEARSAISRARKEPRK